MNLYEIKNGDVVASYVRVYAWAETEKRALVLAGKSFELNNYKVTYLECKLILSSNDGEICTAPSDDGFQL